MKHVLAIHDISCMGRVSLTVALPVISAAGITVSVLPTAVLSTHTGGFVGYTFRDLTEDMIPVVEHWQSLNAEFDAIYTGYLASQAQLDIIADIVRRFKSKKTLVLIDPVMADHGRLYSGFKDDFPSGMARLCKQADIITPNITEAHLLLGEPYREGPYTQEYLQELIKKLGSQKTVLTGAHISDKEYGAVVYDAGEVHFSLRERIPGDYNGTGDLFASVLTAALVKGHPLAKATDIAVEFTLESVRRSYLAGTDVKYGVDFETGLVNLANLC